MTTLLSHKQQILCTFKGLRGVSYWELKLRCDRLNLNEFDKGLEALKREGLIQSYSQTGASFPLYALTEEGGKQIKAGGNAIARSGK